MSADKLIRQEIMKTDELIKLLKKLDPTGDCEVLIGNQDIESYDVLPGYYDGRMKLIKERDEHFRPLKSEVTGNGTKICLMSHDWQETFLDKLEYEYKEYPVEHGGGAAGQAGYNWLDAETIATKFKLTLVAEKRAEGEKDFEKISEVCNGLRHRYINYISDHLTDYVLTGKNMKTHEMAATALKLIDKCKEYQFPLGIFAHGPETIVTQNRCWYGYEFKIDKDGKFFVKDSVNNRKSEVRENGNTYDCTPFVEQDINTYNFNQVIKDYFDVISKYDY